jgi:hypothetical protein
MIYYSTLRTVLDDQCFTIEVLFTSYILLCASARIWIRSRATGAGLDPSRQVLLTRVAAYLCILRSNIFFCDQRDPLIRA